MAAGRRQFVLVGASAALLAACGGGGGDGGDAAPAPAPSAPPAVQPDPVPTSTPIRYAFRVRIERTPSLPSMDSLLEVHTIDPATGALKLARSYREPELGLAYLSAVWADPLGRFVLLRGVPRGADFVWTQFPPADSLAVRAFDAATGRIAIAGASWDLPSVMPEVFSADGASGYAHPMSINAYRVGADGQVRLVQQIPAGFVAPKRVQLHPSGRWLLAEGAAAEPALYRIDPATGLLTGVPRTPLLQGLATDFSQPAIHFAGPDRAFGRFADGRWVLLSFDAADGTFDRLQPAVAFGAGGDELVVGASGDLVLVRRASAAVTLQGYRLSAARDAVAAVGAPLVLPVPDPSSFRLLADPAGPYFRTELQVFRVIAPSGVQATATEAPQSNRFGVPNRLSSVSFLLAR